MILCIFTVSYSILVNDTHKGTIQPTRKLRQELPYLLTYTLYVLKVLSTRLHSTKRERKVDGIKVARDSKAITHLFFTDDNLLFL